MPSSPERWLAESREHGEAEARQREIDDLVAQQGMNAATQAMNEATQRMADDSSDMVLATWVGVFLLTATLVLMIQANRAAVRAAKAADETVKITREAYLNERRPWLFIEAKPYEQVTIEDGIFKFGIFYSICNVGPTPAIHVLEHIIFGLDATVELERIKEVNKLREISISGGTSIFPDKTYEFVQLVSIPADAVVKFLSGNQGFKVLVPKVSLIVAYQSPFGGGNMITYHNCGLYRKWNEGFSPMTALSVKMIST